MSAHLFVYGSLYLLMLGAVWHGAESAGPRGGQLAAFCLDVAVSVALMVFVLRWSIEALRGALE
jgi:hypothetical protein